MSPKAIMKIVLLFFVCCEGLRLAQPDQECSFSTNLQNQSSQEPQVFTHHPKFLYVNGKAQFAFCLIQKNACSHWTAIFNKLESGNLNANHPAYSIENKAFSWKVASDIFRNPSAIRAVFVRDPLERFLSGFLNKCTAGGCTNPFCFMRPKSMSGQHIPFRMAVEWLKEKDPAHLDRHFSLQSKHCELDQRSREYNVIVQMTPSTLAKDASCLLEKAKLGWLNTRGSKEGNSPFWQEPDDDNDATHVELLKSFYTREAAELVFKKFETDYELFGLPRPDWMRDANGKFFDSTRHLKGNCQTKISLPGDLLVSEEEEDDDEDDIVILARRAGYL